MPSLSVLKRPGRDMTPWPAQWSSDKDKDGKDSKDSKKDKSKRKDDSKNTTEDSTNLRDDDDINDINDIDDINDINGIDDNDSNASSTPSHRDRRDFSKRELLHGLISRSIRSAGRALLPESSNASLQPRSVPDQLQPQSQSQLQPRSHSHAHSISRSPSPSFFRSKQRDRDASPVPQRLFQRSRQPSASLPAPKDEKSRQLERSPSRATLQTTPILSTSRSSIINSNKPLPSRPSIGNLAEAARAPKPVLKLNRIMASLSDDDIEKLFSGAPQYFARSEGHFTGAPHPSVAYPWDEALEIRDLTDHVQIENAAWSNVTAWPHITRKRPSPEVKDNDAKPIKKRSHFYPRCRERPSMLSIQGLEKGTVGYEAALELSVSDALQEDQYGFDNLGSRPAAVTQARKNLMDPIASAAAAQSAAKATETGNANAIDESASGVKYVGETQILEELIKNGRRYADGSFYEPNQSKEFYNELFSHILRAPAKKSRTSGQHKRSSSQGSASLDTELIPQIEALLDVLAAPNVWIDFSHVEWRLRLGQVLWASSPEDNIASDDSSPGGDGSSARPATCDERYTERYWLLLQILLATELLLRLDAITDGDEYGLEYVHPSEVHRFEKVANPAVRWSLILARAWLENIEVIRIDEQDESAVQEAKAQLEKTKEKLQLAASSKRPSSSISSKKEASLRHTVGWITTLTRKLSLIEGRLHTSKEPEKRYVYAMKAKNASRQYHGIAHFAQELKWPNDLVDVLSQRALDAARVPEPLNTKITDTLASANGVQGKSQLDFSRRLMRRRKVIAGLHPGGWLSRSYLSGLMLPGDGLCNLLMSTLLEGDDHALSTLGSVAHLGSGFVYRGKSFWSTACVVGRVLSAGAGAAECMGWVSSDVLPQNSFEGWVNIDADDVANDMKLINRRARIWGKAAIERESYVLGDADKESVLPADFVIPYEAVYKKVPPKHTQVELRNFELYSPTDPQRTAKKSGDDSISPAPRKEDSEAAKRHQAEPRFAEIAFSVASEGRPEKVVTYNLAYDAYFTTAHPCVPSQRVKVVKSPSSPTIQQIDVNGGGSPGRSNTVHATGHPLHKYYKYASIHLTELIENSEKSLEELLHEFVACTNRAAPSGSHPSSTDKTVLVIDCITGFSPQPAAHEIPMSPVTDRKPAAFFDGASMSSFPPLKKEISPITALPASSALAPTPAPASASASAAAPAPVKNSPPAANQMHHETRRRRFGSDMEILVRALCAERGWNALISRRRRGCLACAIREAGALGWRVIIRVD